MTGRMSRDEAGVRMRGAELESAGSLAVRTRLRSQAAELGQLRSERDKLLTRIEELEKGLRAILREHQESRSRPNLCRLCGAHDGWPCVTVLEARSALGGEDG